MVRLKSVKELREAAGLTQEEAAQKSGLSVMTVSRMERGFGAHTDSLIKLAPVYGVSLEQMVLSLNAGKAERDVA